MNKKIFAKFFLAWVLFCLQTYLFTNDLKIVDPEDQTSAPDWGEIITWLLRTKN